MAHLTVSLTHLCRHLSYLSCCRSHRLSTPQVALRVFQVCRLVAQTIFICVSALTGVSALANSTGPHRWLVFLPNTAISLTSMTSIGNATIPLTMPTAITTISAASRSYSHGLHLACSLSGVTYGFCGSPCVLCSTWHIR